MVVALQVVVAKCIECAVERTHSICAGRDSEASDGASGAFVDLEFAGGKVEAALGDMMPLARVVGRFGVVDLNLDRHGHVANGADDNNVRSNLEAAVDVGIVPFGWRVWADALVPKV